MDLRPDAVTEEAILFGGSNSLVGIVTTPPRVGDGRPAVILLNAGIIHRVGPGCLYVKLARRLARLGFVVLRFDCSGIGDSPSRRDNLPFARSAPQEAQEAMNYLASTHGVRSFVLGGLCTGAVVSYQAALDDPRVTGLLLLNAQGLIPESEEQVQALIAKRASRQYYLRRALYSPASWRKLFSGGADLRHILGALGLKSGALRTSSAGASPEVEKIMRNLQALVDRGTEMFFVYCEGDPGIDELQIIMGNRMPELRGRKNVRYSIIEKTDHMLTLLAKQETFLKQATDWLQETSVRPEAVSSG